MKRLRNRDKPISQLFTEYFTMLSTSRPKQQQYESERVLKKFHLFIAELRPTSELAIEFIAQFNHRKATTRSRMLYILKGFYRYSGFPEISLRIKEPKRVPQYVKRDDIETLLEALRNKKSHKGCSERDILLIKTAFMAGLRRGELAKLQVQDIIIKGDDSCIIVRDGKGARDRVVPLDRDLQDELASFIRGKSQDDRVFGLAPKSISMKILQWARKAGVPHLHTHSFRHYLATTLFERKANPRDIQTILGHESLETTMKYAAISAKGPREAIDSLRDNIDHTDPFSHVFAL